MPHPRHFWQISSSSFLPSVLHPFLSVLNFVEEYFRQEERCVLGLLASALAGSWIRSAGAGTLAFWGVSFASGIVNPGTTMRSLNSSFLVRNFMNFDKYNLSHNRKILLVHMPKLPELPPCGLNYLSYPSLWQPLVIVLSFLRQQKTLSLVLCNLLSLDTYKGFPLA